MFILLASVSAVFAADYNTPNSTEPYNTPNAPALRGPYEPILTAYPQLDSAPAKWTGVYAGAFGSVAAHSNVSVTPGPLVAPDIHGEFDTSASGGGGGGLVGFNYPIGRIVLGAEADAGLYSLEAKDKAFVESLSGEARLETNYVATFRGRIGCLVTDRLADLCQRAVWLSQR